MPGVCSSDHKPVRACFDLKLNPSGFHEYSFDAFGILLEISNIVCRGLPAMDADGKSDPFVEFRVVSSVGITSDEVHTDVRVVCVCVCVSLMSTQNLERMTNRYRTIS